MVAVAELPPPFTSYETTSTAGGNGAVYTWDVDETGVSSGLYAGRVLLRDLSTSASFRFDGVSGTLKFKCIIYAAGEGCFDTRQSCAWFTGDELINDWTGSLDGNSYKENLLTCHFPNAGTHRVRFSLSMHKNMSKYYVQGPRLEIRDIEWLPDYVDADVDGDALRIEGDWIRLNVSSNVLVDCKYDYNEVLESIGDNGYTVLDSYVAGLTPTNVNSKLIAYIRMTNDTAVITWEPNLETRVYTIYGKTNLTDKTWHSPTNAASRFFTVKASLQ